MRTFYFLLVSQTFLKAEHLLIHSHATFLLMLLGLELYKGQLIPKAIFHGFPYSKKPTKIFTFFALVSKMDQIDKMQNLFILKYTLISMIISLLFKFDPF